MYFLMRLSKPISLLIGGYSYTKEFAPLGTEFFPFKSNPQIRSDTVSTIKAENKYFFQSVWEAVKCQGKNQEKVREF